MTTVQFKGRKDSVHFYESRYSHGYMGYWSAFEKKRLFDLVKSLHLPASGNVLDFGCGRGIFTAVIKEALPGWNVYGCDISREAIEHAKQHSTGINFFVLGEENLSEKKFDFIHSHHVLEHTFDEKITAKEMCDFAAQHCVMMHSLPCNHEGSFEYKVAQLVKNGLDIRTGKFFFEDTAHIRRLNAEQATSLFKPASFSLSKEFYANQYYGAVKWICESNIGLVLLFTDSKKATDAHTAFVLRKLRLKLLFIWLCFFASTGFFNHDRGRYYLVKKIIQAVGTLLLFPITVPVSAHYNYYAKQEWKNKKEHKNGSDMFLVFTR